MSKVRHYIPSMFHRRVLLLVFLCIVGILMLSGRLGYMTVVEGADARAEAEKRLVTTTWLPTTRGRILDRKGRVIAGDRASYNIAIDYRILAGEWVYETRNGRTASTSIRRYATTLARRANPDFWDTYPESEQERVIEQFEAALKARVTRMERDLLSITGMDPDDFEQRKQEILQRVGAMKAQHYDRVYNRLVNEYERTGHIPGEQELARFHRMANEPIAEEHASHTIIPDITDELGFAVLRLIAKKSPIVSEGVDPSVLESLNVPLYPGLKVVDATARLTPYELASVAIDRSGFPLPLRSEEPIVVRVDGVGRQLLGRIDDGLYLEDIQRRSDAIHDDDILRARSLTSKGTDRGRYFPGDRVGRTGIEHAFEHELRGLRGVRIENLQTGEVEEIEREHGRDVYLSIDIMLQARIRALLDPSLGLARVQTWHTNEQPEYTPTGTDLDAGVVVLDIATGEVLAMVSTPNPPLTESEWKTLGVYNETDRRLYNTIHAPWVNKAIAKPYPPGSVAKALILTEAAKRGEYTQGERIHDRGYLLDNQPNKFRSWIYKKHDGMYDGHSRQLGRDLDGVDALMVSSNVFFFTLGRRLGPERIAYAYQDFHVGRPYELGIGTEWAGSVGRFNGPNDGSDINLDEATLMGIGQGPITWTPLHAADALSTIARAGVSITPSIVRDGNAPDVRDIGIPSWAVRDALQGLRQVVENRAFGTGRTISYPERGVERYEIFNVPGLTIWGKTGTAEAPPLLFDPDNTAKGNGPQEPRIVRKGDHSWYVTLVAPEGESPKYAIAVIVEYAGSGGKVSGPINNEIIRALVEEGYLPRVEVETELDG